MPSPFLSSLASVFDRVRRGPRVVVIELHGTLAAREGALNIKSVGPAIDRAFRAARRPGSHVILDIDSPGGSPVHSQLIAARIRRRADEHKIPVTAVVQEVGASGGYWLACAGDSIRAGTMSIVGSIGVVGGGFGFPGLLARVGVERRLYTAGARKARLDPFEPERPEDVAFARRLMEDIHTQFKTWVRTRRGARLARPEDELFDGRIYLGGEALDAGLIDAIGELDTLLHEFGDAGARARTFRPIRRRGWLARLPRMVAGDILDATLDTLEQAATRPDLRL
jgi:signal peptide peptidase SppA